MAKKIIHFVYAKSKRVSWIILKSPLFLLAIPAVISIRLLRPWFLFRIGALFSHRIGHFAANTELYLCERDAGINVPNQRYLDLFFVVKPICNNELLKKWKKLLRIWPTWFLAPVKKLNKMIPGWELHDVGENSQMDRDIHNLLDRFPPHIKFSSDDEARGVEGLRGLGIEPGKQFVCLHVRDSAYLKSTQPSVDWAYHNYRDCNVQNFIMAAEELASRGYYVIRMGVVVKTAMQTDNPKIIDYAGKRMRSEFMDLYLGANCEFCISVGSGFDAIPYIFRRPIVYVNHVPLGCIFTFRDRFISITKHHFLTSQGRNLSLKEILSYGLGYSFRAHEYVLRGVELIENTPEEIKDVVVEMVERLEGNWKPQQDDDELQIKFWSLFPSSHLIDNGKGYHGVIKSRYGASFLRKNQWWLKSLPTQSNQIKPKANFVPSSN